VRVFSGLSWPWNAQYNYYGYAAMLFLCAVRVPDERLTHLYELTAPLFRKKE
jgi:hypothetical protein